MGLLETQHDILIWYIILAIPVTVWGYKAGAKRKIGSTAGMFLGLILGLIGIVIVYCFDKIEEPQYHSLESISDQLKKFKDLLDSGTITEAEYNVQREKIMKPASTSVRLINCLVDVAVIGLLVGLIVEIFKMKGISDHYLYTDQFNRIYSKDQFDNIYLITFFLYYIIFETIINRTIGKILTNTKVAEYDNGYKPEFFLILIRTFVRLIPFIDALSFIGEKRRGWHDSFSNTTVISSATPYSVKAENSGNSFETYQEKLLNKIVIVVVLVLLILIVDFLIFSYIVSHHAA